MNHVTHGRTRSPSASTRSGAWTWSVSQVWFRHRRGRRANTSWARAASGPCARAARSPAVRSRRTARRNVDSDGSGSSTGTASVGAPPGRCVEGCPVACRARAASWRWTAEAFPCQYASSTRMSAVTSNRSPGLVPGVGAVAGSSSASACASHRHTVRSETPRHSPPGAHARVRAVAGPAGGAAARLRARATRQGQGPPVPACPQMPASGPPVHVKCCSWVFRLFSVPPGFPSPRVAGGHG